MTRGVHPRIDNFPCCLSEGCILSGEDLRKILSTLACLVTVGSVSVADIFPLGGIVTKVPPLGHVSAVLEGNCANWITILETIKSLVDPAIIRRFMDRTLEFSWPEIYLQSERDGHRL